MGRSLHTKTCSKLNKENSKINKHSKYFSASSLKDCVKNK